MNYLSHSDILISASEVEGFGITLIEGMQYGLPVICSDIEPHKEINMDGQTGFLFKSGNAKDLSEKIFKYFSLSNNVKPLFQKNGKELLKT